MSKAELHLAAWEAAGLIDHETADRLRAAPAIEPEPAHDVAMASGPVDTAPATRPRVGAASWFGPGVTIAEVFAYLGVGFLIGAYNAALAKAAIGGDSTMDWAVGWFIGAVIVIVIGAALRTGDERASRGAGVLFLVGLSSLAAAAGAFADARGVEWPASGLLAAIVASALALGLRRLHPAVLTQVGLLWALTGTAAVGLAWIEATFFPSIDDGFGRVTSGPDPLVLVIGSAIWWLAVAVILALIGLREGRVAQRDDDPAAGRRAAVSRFWAGFVGVIGLASAVSMSHIDPVTEEYGRTLAPWIGDLALLILSAVLVERAFKRDATSFIYAAALGLIIALTDFNVAYLSASTETALLIEGLILLGVGFGADRLRRRIGGEPPAPVVPASPAGPVASDGSALEAPTT